MKIKANAKINLSLDVVRKREDGYHELDMIFLETDIHDTLEVNITDRPGTVELTCSDRSLETADNIAYRAAVMMFDKYGADKGVSIHIDKKIPMQAGLGGGSSDAAAVLKSMNVLFGYGATNDELRGMGVKLGADVPFFIEGGCARAKGVGEKLRPIHGMPPLHILIVKPEDCISTAYAYGQADKNENITHPDIDAIEAAFVSGDLKKAGALMGNSLEDAVKDRYPVISILKEKLLQCGAYASLMTGSGSAVFGLFEEKVDVEDPDLLSHFGSAKLYYSPHFLLSDLR